MKLLTRCLPLLLLISFTSCNGGKNIEIMDKDIMIIHDEVMPLMVEMKKNRTRLEEKSEGMDSTQIIIFRDAIRDLKSAEDGMWDWMNQYKKPAQTSEEALAYLDSQKKAIQHVSESMKNALSKAEDLLRE